ncbi:MAG: ABC transporter permease subunit [Pseudomonadota bacterium]
MSDLILVIARGMLRAFATTVVANIVAFTLVGYLPTVGVAFLGIGAANPNAVEAFNKTLKVPESFGEAILQTFLFQWGNTLNDVSVVRMLWDAVQTSAPVFFTSCALIFALIALGVLQPSHFKSGRLRSFIGFISFLPAFLPPFVLLAIASVSVVDVVFVEGPWRQVLIGVTVGVVPGCLALAAIIDAYQAEDTKRYAWVLRGFGLNAKRRYKLMRKSVMLPLLPMFQKLVSLQVAILIFAEAIFSYPGFGGIFLSAIQRTDVNLILASIFCISVFIATIRLLGDVLTLALDPRESAVGGA